MIFFKKPIFISLIPNFRRKEIWLSLRLFLSPAAYRDHAWEDRLRAELSAYLGVQYITLTDSGRTAESLLLEALHIGEGDEVIIQAFTCVAVSNAIFARGARPVYADIDGSFNIDPKSIKERISEKTKAILVQHTFGMAADMDEIARLATEKKLVLIEDCAHGLGGFYKEKKLGTIGDAAFFSFGRDKVISGVWGGAIAVRDAALQERLDAASAALPVRGAWWTAKQLLYAPLMRLVTATYSLFGLGKALHAFFSITLFSRVLTKEEKKGKAPPMYRGIPPPLARLILSQLTALESFIEHRREIAAYYAGAFGMPYRDQCTYLRYPMLSAVAADIRKAAAKKNIFLGDWYNVVVGPDTVVPGAAGYEAGSCPRAEEASRHIINLPTHPAISLSEAKRVVHIFKACIAAWSPKK